MKRPVRGLGGSGGGGVNTVPGGRAGVGWLFFFEMDDLNARPGVRAPTPGVERVLVPPDETASSSGLAFGSSLEIPSCSMTCASASCVSRMLW